MAIKLLSQIKLVICRKYYLYETYCRIYERMNNSFFGSIFYQYSLYKSGRISIDEIRFSYLFRLLYNKEYLSIESIKNPSKYFHYLNHRDLELINNNWEGLNDYMISYGLKPCIAEEPWEINYNKINYIINCEKKVTIIITLYNASQTLNRSITSVLNQTYQNIEVIVINDCSSDCSRSLLEEINKCDNRIKLINLTKNVGTYRSRNIALKYATGYYITTHDADDLMHPQHIEVHIKNLIENNNLLGNISYWVRITENGVLSFARGLPLLRINYSSFFFKKNVLEKINGWQNVPFGGDLQFYNECIEVFGKNKFCKIKKPLSIGLFSDSSLTSSVDTGIFSKKGRMRRMHYEEKWRLELIKKHHPLIYKFMNL